MIKIKIVALEGRFVTSKMNIICQKKAAVGTVAAFFILLAAPALDSAQDRLPPEAQGSGSLVGFVYDEDMKAPVPNAVVKIRNLMHGFEYKSGRTDKQGMYTIKKIAAGTYVIGVTAKSKDFNFPYAVALKDSEMAKLSVALKPASAQPDETGGNGKKPNFFKSPAGLVALVVAAGAIIYAIVDQPESSPVIR